MWQLEALSIPAIRKVIGEADSNNSKKVPFLYLFFVHGSKRISIYKLFHHATSAIFHSNTSYCIFRAGQPVVVRPTKAGTLLYYHNIRDDISNWDNGYINSRLPESDSGKVSNNREASNIGQ